MLRIDVNGGSPYIIPPTNPFIDNPGVPSEIWAFGLRNPWRYSFDRQTGDLFIADVGQNAIEEINFQAFDSQGGENYGWRCYEGSDPYNTSGCNPPENYTFPISEYTHSLGRCSITGGYVYRGCAIPEFHGTYFYADYCTGEIWSFEFDGVNVLNFNNRTSELDPGGGLQINNIASFGEDANGELYIVDIDGEIYKIVPDGVASACSQCGDINSSGLINILDLTFLIAYIYQDGPAPDPPEIADVNNSGTLNILDITYLIAYLYQSGPAPDCPPAG
jgi:glucose/arabinose dehydrogenase